MEVEKKSLKRLCQGTPE